jgi:hypothetical protein
MLLDVLRASSSLAIKRVRRLPLPGQVIVNEGEQVNPQDVIGEASLPSSLVMVDIAQALGVDRVDVKRFLVRQLGDDLIEDDVIAQVEGPIARLVRSPLKAKLVDLHQGQAVLQTGQEVIQVRAGLIGTVESIIPEYGAVLAASGLLIQGAWGNGHIQAGELLVLPESWEAPLKNPLLNSIEKGKVLAVGGFQDAEAFAQCEEQEVAGLILGSLSTHLISKAAALAVPLIVLQGFGTFSPDLSLLRLLEPHTGERVCIHACQVDRLNGMRPEVFIPHEDGGEADLYGIRAQLSIGQRVRLFSGMAMGQSGEVMALGEGPVHFESGLNLPAAEVLLEDGETQIIPQQNLAILS